MIVLEGTETPIIIKIADQTVCKGANIYINGTDPPLKDKQDYPEWLWNLGKLYLEKQEVTLETDGRRYLNQQNTRRIREKNKLSNIF